MYLGIDLGTSSVKTLLIDDAQSIVGSATAPLEVSRPQEGWSEQDPNDWIAATENAMSALKAGYAQQLSGVTGIGLSGHMHGATMVGDNGKALRPCILWNDTRSHIQAAHLDEQPEFRNIGGNIVFPGFTAPKLLWVRDNEPKIFSAIHKVLLPKDFLRHWLTGEYVSDPSDAAGTAWLDVKNRRWSSVLLEKSSMSSDQMPHLVEGTEVSGHLRQELKNKWGLTNDVVIAGGGGDNAASAVGIGAKGEGDSFVSLGTSGVLFAANAQYRPKAESAVHTFCHAIPDIWHQMGVILSATDALNWFAKLVGKAPEELTQALGNELRKPSNMSFLPYLAGERTPHNDAAIRGGFIGLAHEHDQLSLTQAVVEGVGFAIKDSQVALGEAGTSLDRVTAVGGGSKSHYWLQVLATQLEIPIDVPLDGDFGAAFGAARLGLIAATQRTPAEVIHRPAIKKTVEPRQDLIDAFRSSYEKYRAAYPAMKEL